MSLWKRFLYFASDVEDRVDTMRGRHTPPHLAVTIVPYIGDGTRTSLRLRGRVLENLRYQPAKDDDSRWRNLRNIYHRFTSVEVPYAQLTARFGDQERTVNADKEGYFLVQFELDDPLPDDQIWQNIQLEYDDGRQHTEAIGRVMLPPSNAQFGVITDLDDTVWRTDVTNLAKLLWNTFTKNSHTRLPFHGVAEFYQALQAGTSEAIFNPIYYVTNSPYNLYDMVEQFFRIRGIPLGPIFLRDIGLTQEYLLASRQHKFNTIDRLLALHPKLPFILIGDSGEHDADIYLQVIQSYPDRIKAVYIRDVEPNKHNTKRDLHVATIAEQVREFGCEMLLIPDTAAAAVHAIAHGFIHPDALESVFAGVSADAKSRQLIIDAITKKDSS